MQAHIAGKRADVFGLPAHGGSPARGEDFGPSRGQGELLATFAVATL